MASYRYEQLNDESFQQLCQSLLLKAFPELQCFPVGQPDGGRDAVARLSAATPATTRFILFQVKFARRELTPSDARDWLLKTLKDELPKVRQQVEEGAERFILVTNVAGTAHQGSGSIDKLQDLLDEHIPITAEAWWRDDLDRRLDNAWDLRFVYPALLSGTDFLRLVMEASPTEDRERRQHAITTFLSEQFNSDREVKFKQAELQNDIFNLFTDVPLVPRIPAERRQKAESRLATAFRRCATSISGDVDPVTVHQWLETALGADSTLGSYHSHEEAWLGAASLLLDRDFQQVEPLIILEGAPGQGKSTIAQYICQVHRMRLLDRQGDETAHISHANSALRLPFKVELRDFATWISGGNPFGSTNDTPSSDSSLRSLEGFLAALVQYASGGSDFNVSDLQAVLHSSPTVIVLDGLDEVADIRQRRRVIEEIVSAVSRLTALTTSLQVVVTSRPTPFMNSTVLPGRTFATYSLDSLTRPLITTYAERWLQSREIDKDDANDVRQILDRQLDEPHLRDLARNPMQLAILLSLIHRRGVSLPDKRTALYDNYVELFFDRESEKASVVKEYRHLLIRIHRYLAWVLHSDAEDASKSRSKTRRSGTSGASRAGTITEEDLKELVRDFLEKEGSDTSLVEVLFGGMVERVVAIVSRVQGSYEFDVQTLREYFAARYLYETAPYSPPGDQCQGTKSDRWNALSRNYYWLNVARFYAGCYSEGEVPSLIDDLRALRHDDVFRYTSHPQLLAATLLGDWVFSQRPRSSQDAVDLLLEPRGLRLLVAGSASGLHQPHEVIIRDSVGRERLISACKELIAPNQPFEQVMRVVRCVLRPNAEPKDLLNWWIEELHSAGEDQVNYWCVIGEHLQCWSVVDVETVTDLLDREDIPSSRVIAGLLHANRMDVLEESEKIFEAAVEAVLTGRGITRFRGSSLLLGLTWSVSPILLRTHHVSLAIEGRTSLREYLSMFRGYEWNEDDLTWPSYDAAERCARMVQVFRSAAEHSLAEWNSSIEPWSDVVQQGIIEFGERTRFVEIANVAAGIRSTVEMCQDSPDLFDVDRPLVRRARYARLRAGDRKWWSKQLRSASSFDKNWMALLLFSTWAGPRTIEVLAEMFDELVASLSPSEWRRLYSSVRRVININSDRSWIKTLGMRVSALPSALNVRTAALLAERCTRNAANELYERYLMDYTGDDSILVSLRTDLQLRRALGDQTQWSQAIESLRLSYGLGATIGRVSYQHLERRLPAAVAREVVDHPLEFPAILVRVAETRCRQLDASSVLPVGEVATDEGWFTD